MRKTVPVLLFTSLFALASGSAFALGDRAKEKKAATGNPTTTQATENPSGSGAPNTTKGMSSTPSSTSANTAAPSSTTAATNGSTDKKSQVAQNDPRCDESKYASRSAMPKECLDKSGTAASAVSSTQGQSGGASGASGAGSAGPGGSSASSSSAGGASK